MIRSLTRFVAGVVCAVVFVVAILQSGEPVKAQAELKGDAIAGKTKAVLCAACHGQEGISINPLWPSLAGQQEKYLVKQMKAFRDGVREEVTMQPFVANLTDQDVADLAAYYTGLSPCP